MAIGDEARPAHRGKTVIEIDRWTPTTKIYSGCGKRHQLGLQDRELTCDCGLVTRHLLGIRR